MQGTPLLPYNAILHFRGGDFNVWCTLAYINIIQFILLSIKDRLSIFNLVQVRIFISKKSPHQNLWSCLIPILLVIRFMTDILRKYRGSVVIMVARFMTDLLRKYRGQLWSWWGETEFTTDPLYFRDRSVINLITNLLHQGPFFVRILQVVSKWRLFSIKFF